jgi:hypothetical protein
LWGIGGVAEEVAVWAVHEGVAALENTERAKGLKACGGAIETDGGGTTGCAETGVQVAEAAAVFGEPKGGMLALKAGVEGCETMCAGAEVGREGVFGALSEIVEVLAVATEGVLGSAEDSSGREAAEALGGAEQLVAAGAGEAGVQACEPGLDLVMAGGEELGGGGGRRRAEVGGCVGEHGVGGVADAGDDRDGAGGDGTYDDFGVEAVEVFPGAAAAGHEDYVDGCGSPLMRQVLRMNGPPGIF